MSDTPLSEAAGDKVAVPMTKKHLEMTIEAFEMLRKMSYGDEIPEVRRIYTAVRANLRSQVESGMTGRFNPETHVAANRDEAKKALLAGDRGSWAAEYLARLLSPSPETPESKP